MDPSDRAELLEEAESLLARRAFQQMDRCLMHLRPHQLIDEPQLGFYKALAWSHLGNNDDAAALIEKLHPLLKRGGNERPYRRLLLLDGVLLLEAGNLELAEKKLYELLGLATEQQDVRNSAAATMNLGALAAMRHHLDEAIANLNRALSASSSAGLWHQVAGCHQNLGMVYRDKQMYTLASVHFDRAHNYISVSGTNVEKVAYSVERVSLKSVVGEYRVGLHLAERVLAHTLDLGHQRLQGEAFRIVGIAQIKNLLYTAALNSLHGALRIAQQTSTKLLEAECLELLAVLAEREHRSADAQALEEESTAIYQAIGIAHGRRHVWFPEEELESRAVAS